MSRFAVCGIVLVAAFWGMTQAAAAHPPKDPPPPAKPGAAEIAARASNTFGLELYKRVAREAGGGNVFISPYSMSVALTMAAEGARGETEAQINAALAIPGAERPGDRAITSVHEGHAAIAAEFQRAAGSADPATRKKIEKLRHDLNDANAAVKKLDRGDNWREAHAAQQKARKLADELNALLVQVDRFDLRIANALWVEKTFDLVPEYVKKIGMHYGSDGVTPLDIQHKTEQSRSTINAWVEEHTENRIKDLIPAGALAPSTRLVITNAVYFKGQWAEPFEEGATREEDFTNGDGKTVRVRMMNDHWRGMVPYAALNGDGSAFVTPVQVPKEEKDRPPTYPDDGGFTMIALPYKGGTMQMVVMLPRSKDAGALAALEERLSAESLEKWLTFMNARTVDTGLPRFKMEFAGEMSDPLKAMGMARAFVSPGLKGGAEFDGMSESADPAKRLFIGGVLHKAWVEVTEKGTEAAAATAMMMAPGAAMRPVEMVPFNPVFRADHPFVFLIREVKTGVVVFVGRVMRPGQT